MEPMRKIIVCGIAVLCYGCASPPAQVFEKPIPVPIPVTQYIPLPADLLADCTGKPPAVANGTAIGLLIDAYLEYELSYVPCLEGKLRAIRESQVLPKAL